MVHTVRGTSSHVSDIAEANTLLHGQETVAFGNAGYQGIDGAQEIDGSRGMSAPKNRKKALQRVKQAQQASKKTTKSQELVREIPSFEN